MSNTIPLPESLTSDQEKALLAEAKTGPFRHTTPSYGNDMQSGETPRLSSKRHAGSTPPTAPAPVVLLPEPDCRLPMDGPPRYRADQMHAYAASVSAAKDAEISRLKHRIALHDPCNGRMAGEPPRYTPECVVLRAEVAGLREDAERYRALKERHGYIMVVRLINADGYSSAEKDALIDAFADAAIADIAAWESLSEAQKALQLDAQAKRAEINAARKGEA